MTKIDAFVLVMYVISITPVRQFLILAKGSPLLDMQRDVRRTGTPREPRDSAKQMYKPHRN
jgi:hypothetical protein